MFDPYPICPKCNGTQFGEGVLTGHASLMPKGVVFSMGSSIIATVCTRCGHITDMKVKEPHKFIPKSK